ncbi:sulfatase [Lacipirellula parvula]|uniref:Arylsulfatase n=1 Tax=Lacipirellula parvula TaxID=2650471 RepID=A0A5K7X339_9BACT|nr:sulfatase [Lacipirellula parvula]BBO30890.1 arylsulfatase [Lacipirellula parvula]
MKIHQALYALLACLPALPVLHAAEQPNVIVILADDMGYADLTCFGAVDMDTPNLDRMAEQGMRLTNFHTAAPTCTASRAAFMTGCYPVRVGMGDVIAPRADGTVSPSRVLWPNSPFGISADEVLIPEVLKKVGYTTGLVGKWHLGDPPAFSPVKHGFDEFFGVYFSNDMKPYRYYRNDDLLEEPIERDLQTKRYTTEAVDFIKRHKDGPFFLYLAHAMPHIPLAASPEFRGKSKRGLYGDAVSEVDWSVGQVFETLKELGIDDNTLVIFSSDNGGWLMRGEEGGLNTPLRGGKGGTYEGGLNVPTIAWFPGKVPAGSECKKLASQMDLLPTFAALAGGETPQDRIIDGHDITPLLYGEKDAKSPWEAYFYYFGNELHGVRSGKWKFRAKNVLKNENIYYGLWRDTEMGDSPMPPALYDLSRDIAETKSVLDNHPNIAKRMRGYMDQARNDLGDSLTDVKPTNVREIGRQEVKRDFPK